MLAAIAPEDLLEVQQERRNIRFGGRTALIQKIHGIFGDNFSRRQYDLSEKAVDDMLPVRKIPHGKKRIEDQVKEVRLSQVHQSQENYQSREER